MGAVQLDAALVNNGQRDESAVSSFGFYLLELYAREVYG
jgi:hypothetical protein